jgi:protein-S-isoprenylcysteine O-methyltransferase Ste14
VSNDDATPRWVGSLLVALQFLLLGLLAWQAAPALGRPTWPVDAILLAAAALGLGLWSLSANRPGNFNIHPAPREGGTLVQHGPYRWIRHPMYSTLLLAGLAAARLSGGIGRWLTLAALAAVLVAKAAVEERALLQRHAGYAAYRRRSWRFVPGLY